MNNRIDKAFFKHVKRIAGRGIYPIQGHEIRAARDREQMRRRTTGGGEPIALPPAATAGNLPPGQQARRRTTTCTSTATIGANTTTTTIPTTSTTTTTIPTNLILEPYVCTEMMMHRELKLQARDRSPRRKNEKKANKS